MVMRESRQWRGKDNNVRITSHKNMDRCTGSHDTTEILLKTALVTPYNESKTIPSFYDPEKQAF